MNRINLIIIIVFSALISIAQNQNAFRYQAIARDGSGNILSICAIGIRVSILSEGNGVEIVYTETHNVVTNIYGLINLTIGKGNVVSGDFSRINWGNNKHYLKMEMDIDGSGQGIFQAHQ